MIKQIPPSAIRPRANGFTLIEVLVSSVILFSVISIMTLIYRGAVGASMKAEQVVHISQGLPFAINDIRNYIRSNGAKFNVLDGQGLAVNTKYSWNAEVVDFKAPPSKFDVDQTKFVDYEKKFKLWLVELELSRGEVKYSYKFEEVSW